MLTTVIACGWGLASAFTLFHALIIKPEARLFMAALVPLVAVWATLERKRWGRLALLGLSATALGLFAALFGRVASTLSAMPPSQQTAEQFMNMVFGHFDDRPEIALSLFALALTTGIWMRRPVVIAEFERGKKATLMVAQRAIALSLVGFWGVTVLLGSPTETKKTTSKTNKEQPQRDSRNNNSGKPKKDNDVAQAGKPK
jgi:hypothetical protein